MRFNRLSVDNFKGINHFEVDDLSDVVVIAGPNGSGKSAAFDAIRLLKSIYGGYQQNEIQNWFGEFQLNVRRAEDLGRMLRRKNDPLIVEATIELTESERDYLLANTEALLQPLMWQSVVGRDFGMYWRSQALSADLRHFEPEVNERVTKEAGEVRSSLKGSLQFDLRLAIKPDASTEVLQSPVIDLMFQTYEPHHLGVIDYHSASRTYQREQVGGINLSLDSSDQQQRTAALYNWQAKYQNVKTELASGLYAT